MEIELTDIEKFLLLAVAEANNYSLKAHNPTEYICKKIKNPELKNNKRFVYDLLKILCNKGYIQKDNHKTFYLTRLGWKTALKLKKEYEEENIS